MLRSCSWGGSRRSSSRQDNQPVRVTCRVAERADHLSLDGMGNDGRISGFALAEGGIHGYPDAVLSEGTNAVRNACRSKGSGSVMASHAGNRVFHGRIAVLGMGRFVDGMAILTSLGYQAVRVVAVRAILRRRVRVFRVPCVIEVGAAEGNLVRYRGAKEVVGGRGMAFFTQLSGIINCDIRISDRVLPGDF